MDFGFWDVIQILGALAFFIYGMKMMSDGIQRAAGSQLRNILRSMTKNRYLGVFTGFLTTALVQSSSATTVMTVSFVNAGLLSLVESAGVMMGANIGTTITGWIISILGFKIKLHTISIPLFAIAVPMLFSKSGKKKYWGEFLIGFAILFLGLSYLKGAVPDIKSNPEMLAWIQGFANSGIFSRIGFVIFGAIITVVVQSSSAAMAITLTLVYAGWLPLDVAAAMILGENIGTTITAELASLVGNVQAKRSARIHSMFNIIGVIWMIIALPWVIQFLGTFVENFSSFFEGHIKVKDNIDEVNTMNTYKLAAFHTFFNLTNVFLLIGFVPMLVKAAIWSVKSKGEEDETTRLKFIDHAQRTPELATVELQKETAHFAEITSRMSGFARTLLNSTDTEEQVSMYKKLQKYEDLTDKIEVEITEYITSLSNQELTPATSVRFRSIMNICNDLERIGDIYYQMMKTVEYKNKKQLYFTPEQREGLFKLMDLVDEAFKIVLTNLNTPRYGDVTLTEATDKEDDINRFRNQLRKRNLELMQTEGYNPNSALIFTNMFSQLEKVGDHLINISEAVVGEI